MKNITTLAEKLKDLRISHGYKNTKSLAEATGIPTSTLNDYEQDEKNQYIPYPRLLELADFYHVSTDYLLGRTASSRYSQCEVGELGLPDEVIDLLRSGTMNHRLLSELMLHQQFQIFLRNVEIYVDGICNQAFVSKNPFLAVAQRLILQQYGKELSEMDKATFQASEIQEERYFKSFFYEDLDIMVKDIKESHAKNKKDTSVQAETIPFPEELIESIVLSAMGQGRSREEQTVLALNEFGSELGFLGELGENPLFSGVSAGSKEDMKEAIDTVKKGNKQWGKQ